MWEAGPGGALFLCYKTSIELELCTCTDILICFKGQLVQILEHIYIQIIGITQKNTMKLFIHPWTVVTSTFLYTV